MARFPVRCGRFEGQMLKAPILGSSTDGAVTINVDRLVETRLLIQANSGAGKRWAIRRLLEQTHGRVQHLVIDVEDEFHTLREKFDYVLAGRHGGDCPADVRSAPLLARRLLELGVSSIIGIFELKHHDRIQFVKLFLESLVNAHISPWDYPAEDREKNYVHLCGQACAVKKLAEWMNAQSPEPTS